ncbi:threonine dehydratase I [Neoconidiobolus thromboides FSU 785]|nr:threonine dehydratase I [Neoconidiobolus thromboides FSU 785]
MTTFDYLKETLTAPVYDVAIETPLHYGVNLTQNIQLNNEQIKNIRIYYKREDLQPVFSFKIRGAYNKIRALTMEQKKNGIVAVSAGNHAQGVALASQKLNIPATIVMPLATPAIKWKNVQRLGANVILKGNDFDEAKLEGQRLVLEQNLTNIPPYDDPYVIAGQGTTGVEILRQIRNLTHLKAIFCCIGGGGLAAGIANYVKRISPHVKVFGVETVDSYAMYHSLKLGKPDTLPQVGLFADGAAVRLVGNETFKLCSEYLDGVILVSNDDICAAIKDIFEDTRSVVEPAGALGVAGLKKWLNITKGLDKNIQQLFNKKEGVLGNEINNENGPFYEFKDNDLILSKNYLEQIENINIKINNDNKESDNNYDDYVGILSGANMNFDRLRFVADRADIGLAKEAFISIVVPETPGSFIKLHNVILPRNVTSFAYRYSNNKDGYIFLSFTLLNPTKRKEELEELFNTLQNDFGFSHPMDLSNNELAKSHARFLVGGRCNVPNERLFRFEFPERPDALAKFLIGLKFSWNVSLFHYRNYGGDTGKVLVGIQIPFSDYELWNEFLLNLNYPWVEETENPVYNIFLK